MPPTLTYPGVYVVEAPSGVHTITGVATSIAAFFGQASKGPIDSPVECLSYSDYTRNFGAPASDANLAQSVQQFFSNGGANCFVVRLADGANPAQVMLLDIAKQPVLNLSAASPGVWGNGLAVTVDYNTPTPDSTFNLRATYTDGGVVTQTESFSNLSMDTGSQRYAPTFITQSSQLLIATAGATTATGIAAGTSEARRLGAVAASAWNSAIGGVWPAGDQGSFQISVDGGPWVTINLSKAALTASGPADATTFAYIEQAINLTLGAASGTSVTVGANADGYLTITSSGTQKSSVVVRKAMSNDLAQPLMLGINQGGIEVARYADLRPVPNGIFFSGDTSGRITSAMDALAGANLTDVTDVKINGVTKPVSLTAGGPLFAQGSGGASDFDGVRENLQSVATIINSNFPGYQATVSGYRLSVQNLKPSSPQAVDSFTITAAGQAATFAGQFVANAATYSLGISTNGTYWTSVTPLASDGNPPTQADYIGMEANRTGFYALDSIDLFNLMVLPGDGITTETEWQAIRAAAAVYCRNRRAFLILDAPVGWTKNNLLNATTADVQSFRAAIGDPDINCAVYYPRVQINDNGTLRYIGASGMIAGVFAATDSSRGVWKAPAGVNAALGGVTDLEVILTNAQNGLLNPQGVNCLRRMPAGYLVWGARTVAGFDGSGDSDWAYVPIRRMTLFLEESLYRGTQWVVFEPNDEPLWAQIRMNIGAFMMGLFRQGAFQGSTPAKAFFVKCDAETTTQADIDSGIVNIVVGFAPLFPAEFVVITIQQIMQS
jgi:phage tail sheath protein FI